VEIPVSTMCVMPNALNTTSRSLPGKGADPPLDDSHFTRRRRHIRMNLHKSSMFTPANLSLKAAKLFVIHTDSGTPCLKPTTT
jgi:hypothetical protein